MSRKWIYTIWLIALVISPIGCFEINENDVDVDDYDVKIAGGTDQPITNFPYAAHLRSNSSTFLCGATILSNTWLITSANCVSGIVQAAGNTTSYPLTARVGTDTLDSGGILLNVTRIVKHALYNATSSDYDFALLEVSNMTFTNSVKAVKLPTQSQNTPIVGPIKTIGWGVVSDSSNVYSTKLKAVSVPIIPLIACRMKYGTSKVIGDKVFCTNFPIFGGKGACPGDNGGSATYRDVLVGVMSGINTCGNSRYPEVFGTVSLVIAWLKGIVGI